MRHNEAEFDYTLFQEQQKADRGIRVKFTIKSVPDKKQTEEFKRPIFRDIEMVEMLIPGRRHPTIRRLDDALRRRFKSQYDAWKEDNNAEVDFGTPLIEYPKISRSLVEELAHFKVKTVEQLALMPDTQASQFQNGLTIKREAEKWLEEADKERPIAELRAQVEQLEAERAELAEAIKMIKKKEENDKILAAAEDRKAKNAAAKKAAKKQ